MTQKYALPCKCGTEIAVEVRQAGDRVTCDSCNQIVDVPRLRELKQYELVAQADSSSKSAPGWSGLSGALFAVGLLLIAISAASAYYTYSARVKYEEYAAPPPAVIEFEHDISEISLIDSWKAWNDFKDAKIASRQQPFHIFARNKVARLNKVLGLFGVFATLGALSMVVSFVVRPS